jgi:hypothetical protein
MHKSICYHVRLSGQNSTLLASGSFGGDISQDTVERLAKSHFTVKVLNSGRAVFADKAGKEVSLYLHVNPETTTIGKEAIRADRVRRAEIAKAQDDLDESQESGIKELMSSLSHDEIVRRLSR